MQVYGNICSELSYLRVLLVVSRCTYTGQTPFKQVDAHAPVFRAPSCWHRIYFGPSSPQSFAFFPIPLLFRLVPRVSCPLSLSTTSVDFSTFCRSAALLRTIRLVSDSFPLHVSAQVTPPIHFCRWIRYTFSFSSTTTSTPLMFYSFSLSSSSRCCFVSSSSFSSSRQAIFSSVSDFVSPPLWP